MACRGKDFRGFTYTLEIAMSPEIIKERPRRFVELGDTTYRLH